MGGRAGVRSGVATAMTPAERIIMKRLRRELRRINPAILGAAKSFIRTPELNAAISSTANELEMSMNNVRIVVREIMRRNDARTDDDIIPILKNLD